MEQVSGNSRFRLNDGDWMCSDPQCGNVNFARRDRCNRCDKEKGEAPKKKKLGQEIGKIAAEKSRGLFSADDWQCNKCGNVNWARRPSCNMCNAPKFGEVEERTGYGGGFNDRGVVEYKERRDSDDEYDEFGRRKKKKKSSEKQGEKEKSDKRDDDEEEEEEEEDDDDDGDLSKYDLSGFGDEEDDSQKEKDRNERKGHKHSRSSSRSSRSQSRSSRSQSSRSSRSRSSRSRSRSPSRSRSRSRSRSPPRKR